MFAQRHPQELLATLPGGRDAFIDNALKTADDKAVQLFRQHPLIQEIIEFLAQSTSAIASLPNRNAS